MKLSKTHEKVVRDLIKGSTLKSHRYLDGTKVYKLHGLDGSVEIVGRAIIDFLKEKGLIDSNKKFPAATYLLTGKGKELAATLEEPTTSPFSAKNY